jgi:hypothetical protein
VTGMGARVGGQGWDLEMGDRMGARMRARDGWQDGSYRYR